jgi:hypothetical protein
LAILADGEVVAVVADVAVVVVVTVVAVVAEGVLVYYILYT